jgi:uncharacterized protein
MKVKFIFASIILVLVINGYANNFYLQKNQDAEKGIEGIWQGTLKISGIELRILFKIKVEQDGSFSATMDSPDQGAKDIPVSEVIFENDSLRIEVKVVMGKYIGLFDEEKNIIKGNWVQSGMTLPLVLKHLDKAPEMNRPQTPEKPYPYNEEEVEYRNEKAGIKLAGTLTFPKGSAPFPTVILITGSGAQNRDEEIFGHRPFLVLADYLTRLGIAVLRVDDRGVGGSGGSISQSTTADFAGDVLSGVRFLKSRDEIDTSKIGLIGHSEGGIIAPMVAANSDDVSFIVLMAGTGLTGEAILYLQAALIAKTNGANEEAIAKNRILQEKLFKILKEETDNIETEKKLKQVLQESHELFSEAEKEKLGNMDSQIDIQLKQLTSKWIRFFLTYDPKVALTKVKCPVLAINGEKDLQVPPRENLIAIEDALTLGGNNNYSIKELPDLNHLFQTATTGSPNEYGKIEETISPSALKIIGDWILELTRNN